MIDKLKAMGIIDDKVTLGDLKKIKEKIKIEEPYDATEDVESVWDKQHGGSHYQKYKIQPSKFVVENELLYPEGCAIKYIIRHRDKGKKQDLLKAIHFIEMIIERDYSEDTTTKPLPPGFTLKKDNNENT